MPTKNKIGLHFTGWEELISNIEKAAGDSGMKKAVEDGLRASKAQVNSNITKAMSKSNLPAGGKYSTGKTLSSLDKDFVVNWDGYTGSINVGFNMEDSGLVSIFLMKGTPKMSPVPGLLDAIYGKKTTNEIKKIQKEAIMKYIQRNLGG